MIDLLIVSTFLIEDCTCLSGISLRGRDIVVARDGWVTPVLEKDATGEEMVEVDTGVDDGVREAEGIGFDDVDTVEATVEGSEDDVAVEHDGTASSKLTEDGPVKNEAINIYNMYKPTRTPLTLSLGVYHRYFYFAQS